MAELYVIQVMAHHGYGLEGWRTVRKANGVPYGFRSFDSAHDALREHFPTLREGLNVRVQRVPAPDEPADTSV
jgi:hypothetical protein